VRKQKQEEQEKEGTKSRKEAEKRSFAQHLQVLVQSRQAFVSPRFAFSLHSC
jgi:hypothetical protein